MENLEKVRLENENEVVKGYEEMIADRYSDMRVAKEKSIRQFFIDSDEITYQITNWGINVKIPTLYDRYNSIEMKYMEVYPKDSYISVIDDIKVSLNGTSFGNTDEVLKVLNLKIEIVNILNENKDEIIKNLNILQTCNLEEIDVLRKKLNVAKIKQQDAQFEYNKIQSDAIIEELKEGVEFSEDINGHREMIKLKVDVEISRVKGLRILEIAKSGKTATVVVTQAQFDRDIDQQFDRVRISTLVEFMSRATVAVF